MIHRTTFWLALPMLSLLMLPVLALVWAAPTDWAESTADPLFWPAFELTLWTTSISMVCILVLGTPLAWWLARHDSWIRRGAALVVDIPIILPPAVVGLALLESFGRKGILEYPLKLVGLEVPFSSLAVVVAQIVVAAPFYIHSATSGFRSVNDDHRAVAMTLGASPWASFWHVSIPMAGPSILGGLGLAWARAIGEFGATLIFAGNLPGVTQTMPLAIYAALDRNVTTAVALSLVLTAAASLILLLLRSQPQRIWTRSES